MNKFVAWGHKLHSHTHSYIHYGYMRAFEELGFKVYWFDNNDDVSNFDFNNCIFLTEGQVDHKIPLNKNSFYILHHCDNTKYKNNNCNFINLCNYVYPCEIGISYNYNNSSVTKIKDFLFLDNTNKAIYQPWATDLLPKEINIDNPIKYDYNIKEIHQVASIHHDNLYPRYMDINKAILDSNRILKVYAKVSPEQTINFIKDSYVSFDLRGDLHLKVGYIPCRIFKNISYGKPIGTNSKYIKQLFGDHVIFNENCYNLYFDVEREYKNMDMNHFKESMKYIRDNHTYINRVENILKLI